MITLGRVSKETKGVGKENYEDLDNCVVGGPLIDKAGDCDR